MSTRELITCRELIGFIADYLDGTLPPVALEDFHRHIERCASCRAYLSSYEWTIRLGKISLIDNDDAAEDAPEELVAAILSARGSSGRERS
jgi:anti-sigma factor RsiW